jgi:hypothetical protein
LIDVHVADEDDCDEADRQQREALNSADLDVYTLSAALRNLRHL